jgi:hypothetical protein
MSRRFQGCGQQDEHGNFRPLPASCYMRARPRPKRRRVWYADELERPASAGPTQTYLVAEGGQMVRKQLPS